MGGVGCLGLFPKKIDFFLDPFPKTKTKTTNQLEFIKSEVMKAMVLAASSQFATGNELELGSMDLATN